jgi:hypothetical protein
MGSGWGKGWTKRDKSNRCLCRNCDGQARDKPKSSCSEPKHMIYYNHLLEYMRRRRKNNHSHVQEIARKSWLKKTYNLSTEDIERMKANQNNSCVICLTPFDSVNKPYVVEHNHRTSKVRGLSCHRCNIMIGFLEKYPKLIEPIQRYLNSCSD